MFVCPGLTQVLGNVIGVILTGGVPSKGCFPKKHRTDRAEKMMVEHTVCQGYIL